MTNNIKSLFIDKQFRIQFWILTYNIMKHPFPLCYSRYKFFFRQKLYIEQVTQGTDILNMSRQAKDLAESSNKESRFFLSKHKVSVYHRTWFHTPIVKMSSYFTCCFTCVGKCTKSIRTFDFRDCG